MAGPDKVVLSDEPRDRLTRICDRLSKAFDEDPETLPDDKCIIFTDSPKMGGIVLHRYDDSIAGIAALLQHLQAMFKGSGKRLDIMFLDDHGANRFDG